MEIQEVIETIRARGIALTVNKGGKIGARPPGQLTREEREFITGHRAEVIEYLKANSQSAVAPTSEPESPEVATCDCVHHRDGYARGVRETVAEYQARAQTAVADKPAPTPTTPDGEVAKFLEWQLSRSGYYQWEASCMAALRAALQPGDRVRPRFAYSCTIIHPDGLEEEFERKPPR